LNLALRILLVAFVVLLSGGAALADDDYERALDLRQRGEILPLASILNRTTAEYPGRVLKAEIEEKSGQIVYEIELLGRDSIVREMMIDAKTGRLLSIEGD